MDQPFQDDFARDRLRYPGHGRKVEVVDWRRDRVRRAGRWQFRPQVRISLVELLYLAVGTPTQVAVARVLQIQPGNLLKTARRIEAGREFAGERLIVDKAMLLRRVDGLLVELFGIKHAAFDAGDLRPDQCGTVFEILRTILRPDLQLPVMCSDSLQKLLPLAGWCGVAPARPGQRTIKVIFGFLKVRGCGPEQRLRLRCGVHGRSVVAGDIACLQFPDPVPTLRDRQGTVAGQMVFGAKLIELSVVKATEFQRQAAEHPDQRELRGDAVDDKAESRLLSERKALFRFALRLRQRVAGEESVRVEMAAGVGAIHQVSDPVRRAERAAQQITANPHVFDPAHHETREGKTRARLEAFEPAPFDEFVTELAKSESGLVVVEKPSSDPAEHHIGDTGSIAVATLEAEIDPLADRQGRQIPIRMRGRRQELT
ncbi:hypothetical protein LMG28614_07258 [Paraburkholderia ultramafica]|uniref:Uncharacterized protein n=1 Tax=Paraburkholderia ultramafica TaxID=1544867 RepID=A0A6S7BR44_9BURK|nr:hypothetical protein LMG28614_07258 [Paraburkholderia ultramafica]